MNDWYQKVGFFAFSKCLWGGFTTRIILKRHFYRWWLAKAAPLSSITRQKSGAPKQIVKYETEKIINNSTRDSDHKELAESSSVIVHWVLQHSEDFFSKLWLEIIKRQQSWAVARYLSYGRVLTRAIAEYNAFIKNKKIWKKQYLLRIRPWAFAILWVSFVWTLYNSPQKLSLRKNKAFKYLCKSLRHFAARN